MSDAFLSRLPVLVVDCQTTGATPGKDQLLEVAWALLPAAAGSPVIHSFVVRLPEGVVIPDRISRMTGIGAAETSNAPGAREVWHLLRAAVAGRVPVAHFAVFEQRWLDHLFAGFGGRDARFPRIICTREIARRLYPGLPRKGLRPVAGYLGHDMAEPRRAGDHVAATASVWREMTAELDASGIRTVDDLSSFLSQPAPVHDGAWDYHMPRDARLSLPDSPGVYRFLSCDGMVLYAGKAASLRRRVNSYFTRRRADGKTLELVSRACSVEVSPTETALEAALEEARVIRALDPPYNIALRERGMCLVHLRADLSDASGTADPLHPVGPLPEQSPAVLLHVLLAMLTGGLEPEPSSLGMKWLPPARGALEEGLELFRAAHMRDVDGMGRFLSLGRMLWVSRAEEREEGGAEDEGSGEAREAAAEVREEPGVMDAGSIMTHLEWLLAVGARDVRRAACFRQMGWSVIRWRAASGIGVRWLRMECGAVAGSGWQESCPVIAPSVPVPASPRERQQLLTPAAFDLLKVLVSELRRVSASGRIDGIDLPATGATLDASGAAGMLRSV
jgi:DNA polymerase-3 subunit epsilon